MKRNTGNLLPFLTRKAGTSAVFGVVCLLGLTRPSDPAFALEYDGGIAVISLHGFIEGRALSGSRALSWENGGFGKTPFGGRQSGENRAIGHVQTGAALQIRYGWDWSANVIVTASGRQYHTVDLQEVFLRYKPAPTGDIAIDARIGIMFPPVSLENDGIAWTSPFTLSPSAINAWIGDEVRGLGGELAASWRFNIANENLRLRADAGLFGYDDPAGALLAWRGWAVHDQTAGVFERHQLPPIRTLRPGGNIAQQAPWVEPFHELDGRPGYYAGLSLESDARDQLRLLFYDNRADSQVFDGRQYAWHTRFGNLGISTSLPGDIDFISQAMFGRTTMALRPPPLGGVVDMDFSSAFVLVSRAWDKHRISARLEYFDTRDHDFTPDDNNAERGNASTLAYIFRPADIHRLTFEVARVYSDRAERVYAGFVRSQIETIAQASWRIIY